jgi:2-iminobutanoate/2-iminopropanoate deaminase
MSSLVVSGGPGWARGFGRHGFHGLSYLGGGAADAGGFGDCFKTPSGSQRACRSAMPASAVRYDRAMPRQTIATLDAPKAIGPYAQAVSVPAGRLVFCSGQIPLDPTTGEFVGAGDVRAQTERVMRNLAAVLTAAGASFADVAKTTIFLTDLQDFAAVNEVYARFVGDNVPARATVQVAGLPKGANVEIEAVAVV